ncbi:MAG TPA: hypothetical protein VGB99_19135, partial [Acidobacteriota bacterium]
MRSQFRALAFWFGAGLAVGLLDATLLTWLWSPGHFDKYLWLVRQTLAGAPPWHRLADFSPGYLGFLLLTTPLTNADWWKVEVLQLLILGL